MKRKRRRVRGDVDLASKRRFTALLEQDIPILRRPESRLEEAAGNALEALAMLQEVPELVEQHMSVTDADLWKRFEGALVLSYALQNGIKTKEALIGLGRMLTDDEEMIRRVALEAVVEHSWNSRKFSELDALLGINEIREEVLNCIISASIRNRETLTSESFDYIAVTIAKQAMEGNSTALTYIREMEAMAREGS